MEWFNKYLQKIVFSFCQGAVSVLYKFIPFFIAALLLAWSTPGFAAIKVNVPNLIEIFTNINQQLPGLWKLVTGATYLAGFWCAFRALYELKEYGELRMMMATHTDVRKPIVLIFISLILLYWPKMIEIMMQTTFGTPVAYAYHLSGGQTAAEQYRDMFILAGNIVQFIGFIAFIRGWMLFTAGTGHGSQTPPGTFAKAVTHVVAGLLAINIFGTWKILAGLFGLS